MALQRRFFLGDEWVYYKIYSGPKKTEEILTNDIYELVINLYESKKIVKFFFIRYSDDGGSHIRIRFLVSKNEYIYDIIKDIYTSLNRYVQLRIVSKITTDTYNREIERYGAESMEDVETIFSHNSWDCLMALNKLIEGDDTLRWLYGIQYMDKLLTRFGLSNEEKYAFCNGCFISASGGRTTEKHVKVGLDTRYRQHSKEIEGYMASAGETHFEACRYTADLDNAINNILGLYNEREKLYRLLHSITHMHFNRFFRTKQPANELAIYYLMAKYYKSYEGRLKYQNKIAATS